MKTIRTQLLRYITLQEALVTLEKDGYAGLYLIKSTRVYDSKEDIIKIDTALSTATILVETKQIFTEKINKDLDSLRTEFNETTKGNIDAITEIFSKYELLINSLTSINDIGMTDWYLNIKESLCKDDNDCNKTLLENHNVLINFERDAELAITDITKFNTIYENLRNISVDLDVKESMVNNAFNIIKKELFIKEHSDNVIGTSDSDLKLQFKTILRIMDGFNPVKFQTLVKETLDSSYNYINENVDTTSDIIYIELNDMFYYINKVGINIDKVIEIVTSYQLPKYK